jgi:hypothetical protein
MNTQQAHINGFVKRAAEHGLNQEQALAVLKSAGSEVGPFDADNMARMLGEELELKAMAHNREHHPAHYYANPFVAGPLTEALTRLHRRRYAGLAGDNGLASELLGGGLLNSIRGDESMRNKIRDRFERHVGGHDPE